MADPFTSDAMLEEVRDITGLPDAHWLTTARLLTIADAETRTLIAERVKLKRGEHWLKLQDTALVPGTTRYRLPRRALGRAVHSIALVDANGAVSPLTEIDAAEASSINSASWSSSPPVYYIEDEEIVFVAQPPSGYSMRVRYLRRPNRLVPVASALAIAKRSNATTLIATTNPLLTFTELGDKLYYFDVVRGDAPFDLSYVDQVCDGTDELSFELTFTTSNFQSADFEDVTSTVGLRQDYVCLRDTTVYPQLPAELHPVLVSALARRVMEAIKDKDGAELAQATLNDRSQAASAVIDPRNQDRSRAIVNRFSALRGGGNRRRGSWGRP